MGYKKEEYYDVHLTEAISNHFEDILFKLGENPEREGLQKTPKRVAKSFQFLTHGYDLNPAEILRSALFHEAYDEIAVLHEGCFRWHGDSKQAREDQNPWLRQLLEGRRDGPIETIQSDISIHETV